MVEFLLTMGIFGILAGIATINLVNVSQRNSLNTTVDIFVADLKEQQLKAMVGDTEGSGSISNYGIRFSTSQYTMFRSIYGTSNFVINLPGVVTVTSTFPNNEIVFLKGSGELSSFTAGSNTITLTDTTSGQQKVLTINRYGVVTGIN